MALTKSSRWLMLCLTIALGRSGRSAPFTNIGDDVTPPPLSASIERFLLAVTSNLPELHVMLRAAQLHNDADNVYIRWFLRQRHCPVEVGSYALDGRETEPMLDDNRDSYVIITGRQQLRASAKRFVQRAGVFFFVLLPDDEASGQEHARDEEMAQIRDVMHLLWTHYSLYKNYLLTTDQRVLIYDPFDYDAHSDRWGRMREATFGGEPLELALFRNMRGYPLRVQIFRSVYARPVYKTVTKSGSNSTRQLQIQGADGKVADLLCEQLNFTMILLDPDPNYFGERNANGTYNGAIGGIIEKRIDLCLTGFFVKDYMVPEMEFSVAVYDDQLCIYVHKANRVPQSILPVFSVRGDLWLGFILTACVCAGVWCLMRLLNLRLLRNTTRHNESEQALASTLNWQMVHILIDTWVVWVRVNVLRFPPFSSERIFVASLCLVSVIFGAIFESSLATVYIHPMYYKDINTMRELDDSGLKVIYKYSSMAVDLFFSDTSPLFASLNKKLTHLSNLNADVMADVAAHGGKAGVTRYSSLMLESFDYVISKRVWIIPECPKYYTIAYVLPKDSPWQEAVNDLLLRLLNAGLINKWVSEMQTDVDIAIMREHRFQSDDTMKVLTVEDLQLAFYVICAGSALAFASFILERYLKGQQRCCRWRRNNAIEQQ